MTAAPAAEKPRRERSVTLDIMKGLLVIAMIAAHALSIFAPTLYYAFHTTTLINLSAFPGFLFAFGFATQLAYFRDPEAIPWRRVLITVGKITGAYFLSGLVGRLLLSRDLSLDAAWQLLTFQALPSYTEFLIAFALAVLVAALLAKPLARLTAHRWALWIAFAAPLILTFFPYDTVDSVFLSLFVGAEGVYSFPVVQYGGFFLLGMIFAQRRITLHRGAVLLGAVGLGLLFLHFETLLAYPGRFPPSLVWMWAAFGAVMVAYALSGLLALLPPAARLLAPLGYNVLFYLVGSNMALFALRAAYPDVYLNFEDALLLTAGIIVAAAFMIAIVTPGKKAPAPEKQRGG